MSFCKFLRVGESESEKTQLYQVRSMDDVPLGEIKWHAPWRRYVFFPLVGCLFDAECLMEIGSWIYKTMARRKELEKS